MEHKDLTSAILHLRPEAKFVIRGEDIEWMDEDQIQPTEEEIKAGWVAYQAKEKAEAKAKEKARTELLNRLGITADEAAILLG
jgi:hypothetical protein